MERIGGRYRCTYVRGISGFIIACFLIAFDGWAYSCELNGVGVILEKFFDLVYSERSIITAGYESSRYLSTSSKP